MTSVSFTGVKAYSLQSEGLSMLDKSGTGSIDNDRLTNLAFG